MSITAVQSQSILIQTPAAPKTPAVSSQQALKQTPSGLDSQDVVEIKSGVMPSLKGAGAGALSAGGSALLLFTVLSKGKPFAGEGAIVSGPLTLAAALGGAVGGGVSANYTDSKSRGALIGGLAGAGVSVTALALMNLKDGPAGMASAALAGAVVGGITGAVGGIGGALVAQKQ